VLAGLLPDPEASISALVVAFNVYGVLFMGFVYVAMSVGTRVGNLQIDLTGDINLTLGSYVQCLLGYSLIQKRPSQR
jgi:hypothetical protein